MDVVSNLDSLADVNILLVWFFIGRGCWCIKIILHPRKPKSETMNILNEKSDFFAKEPLERALVVNQILTVTDVAVQHKKFLALPPQPKMNVSKHCQLR